MSSGVLELPRRPKAGDRCPTCWDKLSGTLVEHCPGNTQCRWLRCNECGHQGRPEGIWLRVVEKTA